MTVFHLTRLLFWVVVTALRCSFATLSYLSPVTGPSLFSSRTLMQMYCYKHDVSRLSSLFSSDLTDDRCDERWVGRSQLLLAWRYSSARNVSECPELAASNDYAANQP